MNPMTAVDWGLILYCRCDGMGRVGDGSSTLARRACMATRSALRPACSVVELPPPDCADVLQRCLADIDCRSADVRSDHVKPAFHDTDTDILATILADTSDTRDFLKIFLWQAERGSRPTHRHPRDDPCEGVGEDAGVGVVECDLYASLGAN